MSSGEVGISHGIFRRGIPRVVELSDDVDDDDADVHNGGSSGTGGRPTVDVIVHDVSADDDVGGRVDGDVSGRVDADVRRVDGFELGRSSAADGGRGDLGAGPD